MPSLFTRRNSYASTLLASATKTTTLHTDTITATGAFTWVCPAGVTVISITAVAGCGGGGAAAGGFNGGGGGGGAAVIGRYTVSAGSYTGAVGAGGAAGADGSDTTFDGTNLVAKKGIKGAAASGAPGVGGAGGSGSTAPAGTTQTVGTAGTNGGAGGAAGSGSGTGGAGGVSGGAAAVAGSDGFVVISYAIPVNGDPIKIKDPSDCLQFVLDVSAGGADATDTLNVVVQTQADGTNWVDVCRFTAVGGNAAVKRYFGKIAGGSAQATFNDALLAAGSVRHLFGDTWRVQWTVVSGNAATFTFSVIALPL